MLHVTCQKAALPVAKAQIAQRVPADPEPHTLPCMHNAYLQSRSWQADVQDSSLLKVRAEPTLCLMQGL